MKVRNKFLGEITQVPPMYSAIKHKGKSLYKYARRGVDVKRQPRKVFIENFEIKNIDLPEVEFEIECSKGTYLRVIADDFGSELGCGGYLKNLRRTKIGEYLAEDALKIQDLESIVAQ
jgi:tRNA pseudouridine55 synthase